MTTALVNREAIRSLRPSCPGVPDGQESSTRDHASNRGPVPPAARSAPGRDAQLSREVEQALRATGYLEWHDVQVHASGGQLVLAGVVPSYFLKQVARTAARHVPGVSELRNELTVHELNAGEAGTLRDADCAYPHSDIAAHCADSVTGEQCRL